MRRAEKYFKNSPSSKKDERTAFLKDLSLYSMVQWLFSWTYVIFLSDTSKWFRFEDFQPVQIFPPDRKILVRGPNFSHDLVLSLFNKNGSIRKFSVTHIWWLEHRPTRTTEICSPCQNACRKLSRARHQPGQKIVRTWWCGREIKTNDYLAPKDPLRAVARSKHL